MNVASVSGITPSARASNYCVSKAAVRIFSKTAAIECDAKNGIRVNVVTPGGVKTPMWEKEEFFKALVAEHGGLGVPLELPVYRERSHRRLDAKTYTARCLTCIWGCRMPVDFICRPGKEPALPWFVVKLSS